MEVEQLLDLVAQQEQRASTGPNGTPEHTHRGEEILAFEGTDFDLEVVETILGIEQGIDKTEVELIRIVGALKIPEDRQVVVAFG